MGISRNLIYTELSALETDSQSKTLHLLGGFTLGLFIDSLFTPIGEMTLNEQVLENIYEELMDELTDTGNLPMYSQEDIRLEVMNRFHGRTP